MRRRRRRDELQRAVLSGRNIDTSTVGAHTFKITAADKVGNTNSQTVKCNVVYKFRGFLPPLMKAKQTFRAGSTILVTFQVTDINNKPVSRVVAQIWIDSTSNPGKSSGAFNTGNNFRHVVAGAYLFNLSTKGLSKGSHMIIVTLDDGTHYSTTITIQ